MSRSRSINFIVNNYNDDDKIEFLSDQDDDSSYNYCRIDYLTNKDENSSDDDDRIEFLSDQEE